MGYETGGQVGGEGGPRGTARAGRGRGSSRVAARSCRLLQSGRHALLRRSRHSSATLPDQPSCSRLPASQPPSPAAAGAHLLLDLVPDHPAAVGEGQARGAGRQAGHQGAVWAARQAAGEHSCRRSDFARAMHACVQPSRPGRQRRGHSTRQRAQPRAEARRLGRHRQAETTRWEAAAGSPRHLIAIQVHHRVLHLDLAARCRRHGPHACAQRCCDTASWAGDPTRSGRHARRRAGRGGGSGPRCVGGVGGYASVWAPWRAWR